MTTSVFTALADPTRRELLVHLARTSPKTATQLAQVFPISRQGILKHLNILEAAGLVGIHQAGRDKRYALKLDPLSDVQAWVAELTQAWDERLLRLKELLESEED